MEKKKYDVEFHGTSFFALVPLLLFVVFCILFFVVFKTFDMMHLCMGGYVSLIIQELQEFTDRRFARLQKLCEK